MKRLLLYSLLITLLMACGNKTKQAEPVATAEPERPEWVYDAVLYEVNTRQFTPAGTFPFADELPRLNELGVDILWFMPIQPIGEKDRKGTLGSYYSISDYTAVNSEFGTLDDFRR